MVASTADLARRNLYLVACKILLKLAATAEAAVAVAVAEVAETSAYSNPSQYAEVKEVEVVENMLQSYKVIPPLFHQTEHIDSLVELAEVVEQMKLDSGSPGIQAVYLLIVQVPHLSIVVVA